MNQSKNNGPDNFGFVDLASTVTPDSANDGETLDATAVNQYFVHPDTEMPAEFPLRRHVVKNAREFCVSIDPELISVVAVLDPLSLAVLLKHPKQFAVKAARLVGVPGERKGDAEYDNAVWSLPTVTYDALSSAIAARRVAEQASRDTGKAVADVLAPDPRSREGAHRPRVSRSVKDSIVRTDRSSSVGDDDPPAFEEED